MIVGTSVLLRDARRDRVVAAGVRDQQAGLACRELAEHALGVVVADVRDLVERCTRRLRGCGGTLHALLVPAVVARLRRGGDRHLDDLLVARRVCARPCGCDDRTHQSSDHEQASAYLHPDSSPISCRIGVHDQPAGDSRHRSSLPNRPTPATVDCELLTADRGAYLSSPREGMQRMPDAAATGPDTQAETRGEKTPRLENLTLWERVHQHLREEILANRLPAGTELSEVALARQLGVSRGPIRESIVRLASEGLVLVRPRRGAVVRSLSRDEFVEAYQVREALEVMAVRLAVPRLTAADFDELGRLNDELVAVRRRRRRRRLLRDQRRLPLLARRGVGQRDARRDLPPAARPDGPLPHAVAVAARQPAALDRRAPGDRAARPGRATSSGRRA